MVQAKELNCLKRRNGQAEELLKLVIIKRAKVSIEITHSTSAKRLLLSKNTGATGNFSIPIVGGGGPRQLKLAFLLTKQLALLPIAA